jgi:hypothetical protein
MPQQPLEKTISKKIYGWHDSGDGESRSLIESIFIPNFLAWSI